MTFRSYAARLEVDDYIDVRRQQNDRPDIYDRRGFDQGQAFGEQQRAVGHDGILYDSLRHASGVNVVCFVPTKVLDVVQQNHFEVQVYAEPGRKPIVIRL